MNFLCIGSFFNLNLKRKWRMEMIRKTRLYSGIRYGVGTVNLRGSNMKRIRRKASKHVGAIFQKIENMQIDIIMKNRIEMAFPKVFPTVLKEMEQLDHNSVLVLVRFEKSKNQMAKLQKVLDIYIGAVGRNDMQAAMKYNLKAKQGFWRKGPSPKHKLSETIYVFFEKPGDSNNPLIR